MQRNGVLLIVSHMQLLFCCLLLSSAVRSQLNSSLTIGQLPPADTGLGQFGSMSTPQDFFSM